VRVLREEFAIREKELALFAEGLAAFYRGQFAAAEGIFAGFKERDPMAAAREMSFPARSSA
jgi:hypothetical protein